MRHFYDNQLRADKRGLGEEYIYKFHHDGPTKDYGGLDLSIKKVMPLVSQFESLIKTLPADSAGTSISQVAVAQTTPAWWETLYSEVKDGASSMAGWVQDELLIRPGEV